MKKMAPVHSGKLFGGVFPGSTTMPIECGVPAPEEPFSPEPQIQLCIQRA